MMKLKQSHKGFKYQPLVYKTDDEKKGLRIVTLRFHEKKSWTW